MTLNTHSCTSRECVSCRLSYLGKGGGLVVLHRVGLWSILVLIGPNWSRFQPPGSTPLPPSFPKPFENQSAGTFAQSYLVFTSILWGPGLGSSSTASVKRFNRHKMFKGLSVSLEKPGKINS